MRSKTCGRVDPESADRFRRLLRHLIDRGRRIAAQQGYTEGAKHLFRLIFVDVHVDRMGWAREFSSVNLMGKPGLANESIGRFPRNSHVLASGPPIRSSMDR